MNFDDIVSVLGDFGTYQKRLFFLSCIPAVLNAMQIISAIFTLDIPKHRCRLPDLYNDTSYIPDNDVTRFYVNYSIPVADGKWSECKRYDVNLTQLNDDSIVNKNTSTFNCHTWLYDTSTFQNTFVTEQNLICDKEIYRSHANMIVMAGIMCGSLSFGIFSDVFGRKKGITTAGVLFIASAIGTAFAPNFIAFVVIRFVNSAAGMGAFLVAFVIAMEFVGKSKRTFTGAVMNLFWCVGLFILDFLAYFIRDWKYLQLAISVPSVIFLLIFWLVPESPRWLVLHNQPKQAEIILRKAAKVNGVELPEKLFDEVPEKTDNKSDTKLWELLATPALFARTMIIFFNWVVVTMVYYGLGLNVGNLGGDVYINFTVANIVESLAYVLVLLLLDRLGRKSLLCTSMLVGGVACVSSIFPVIFGDESHQWIVITLSMIGKLGASAAFSIVYIFSAELFPTVVRTSAVGVCSFLARIGGMVSPYIADLGTIVKGDIGTALPLIVFGGASVIAGLLSLYLPETLNKQLPETIEDAKHFGRRLDKDKQFKQEKPRKVEIQTISRL